MNAICFNRHFFAFFFLFALILGNETIFGRGETSEETLSFSGPQPSQTPQANRSENPLPNDLSREEQTFYLTQSDPKSLINRFLAILPEEERKTIRWKIDPQKQSLTLSAPPQIIATAAQLIPRMDVNLQLSGEGVDYGVSQLQERPVSLPDTSANQDASAQNRVYYDPNENRMVRVGWENENAYFPTQDAEDAEVYGENRQQAPQGENLKATPDVVVYRCPSQIVDSALQEIRAKYINQPEVMITADRNSGVLLVYAPLRFQAGIQNDLAAMKIYPASSQGNRSAASSPSYHQSVQVIPNEPTRADRAETNRYGGSYQTGYTPVYKNLSALEGELSRVFRDRIEKIFPMSADEARLSPAEREKTVYRFIKRKGEANAQDRPSCEIRFEPARQTVFINGDPSLCQQMKTLLERMDRESQSEYSPQYILLRNIDSDKINNFFQIQNESLQKETSDSTTQSSWDGASLSPKFSEKSLLRGSDRLVKQSGTSSPKAKSQAKKKDSPQNPRENTANKNPIRPVNYQSEGGNDTSGKRTSGNSGKQSSVPNHYPSDTDEFNVVSDYIPTVLPDLDIVIIDAPPAEAKRITDMIAKIEELASKANPEVEIYHLHYVNSIMLGGVLQRLHAEMFMTKQGRVLAYPIQNPNAVLLVGWGKALESMKDLIQTFDQPIQGGTSMIRVISLKYQSATKMATVLNQYFPPVASETGGFAPRIRVVPDARTNSLLVQAAPNDLAEIQQILINLDINRSQTTLEVRRFSLKNTLADNMRTIILNAILPAVNGTLPLSETKYPILEILSVDSQSQRLITSGIMTDVQITADPYKNQLVVTAPSDCMELFAELIEVLDVPAPTGQLKVFQIKNGDATQLQKALVSLLPTGMGSMPSVPNATGETSFVPIRFSVEPRTNSILAIGAPNDLKIIDALITTLDRKDADERKQEIVHLRNVNAQSIANAVTKYLNEKQQLEMSSETVSDHQLFESQVIVVPEPVTNAIIISATPRFLDEIKKLIESFDDAPAQVVIQVLIAEVTLTDQEEFGIEAGLQDKVAFDRSVITSVASSTSTKGNPGYNFVNNNSIGEAYNSGTDSQTVAGQVLNNLGMGRVDSDLGYGGLVLSASSRSVSVLLRALRDKNRLQVLSRPQIQAMDNQQAFILVGKRVPRVSGASTTTYGVTSNVTDANVGLILLVTPRIGTDGRVIMEIGAEKSSIGSDSDAIPVFTSDGQIITSPTIETTQIMTAVSATNGETVMLGGMISSTKEKISRGVPYLSDVPILGWLFRYDKDTESRSELLIVMTPRIVKTPEDAEQIKRVEASKLTWCLADAMSIHGNMGLYDPLNTQETARQTKLLPFVESGEIEEIPSSSVKPYSPSNDYQDLDLENGPTLPTVDSNE